MEVKNEDATTIHIVGVGGQGALTVSKIIGNAALAKDLQIVVSEIHGMAQRGGVVQTTIRIGDTISPLPFSTDMNLVMGFEPMEVFRARDILTPETVVIFNRDPIMPVTVSSGGKPYPDVEEILGQVDGNVKAVYPLSAKEKAGIVGNDKVTNVVMLGALAATDLLPFTREELIKAVKVSVPEKAIEDNLKAFELGFESVREQ